jgi:hypothetical protein
MTIHSSISPAIDDNHRVVPADPEPKNGAVKLTLYITTRWWETCIPQLESVLHAYARTRTRSGLSRPSVPATECIARALSADLPHIESKPHPCDLHV